MAVANFSATVGNIIQEAYEQLGVLAEGEVFNDDQYTAALRTLNYLVNDYQARGLNLFAVRETFLFLVKDKFNYDEMMGREGTLGLRAIPGSGNSGQAVYTPEFKEATSEATASGSTDIPIITNPDATFTVAGSSVGIPQADGSMHWTTITGTGTAGTGGFSIIITDALTAALDTTKTLILAKRGQPRPIKIASAILTDFRTNFERPIENISFTEYSELTAKNQSMGTVNQMMYSRGVNRGSTYLRVWPAQSTWDRMITLWVQVPVEELITENTRIDLPDSDVLDTGSFGNTGFPQEFFWCLAINLARRLVAKLGVEAPLGREIRMMAQEAEEEAFSFDTGDSMYIQPDTKFWHGPR